MTLNRSQIKTALDAVDDIILSTSREEVVASNANDIVDSLMLLPQTERFFFSDDLLMVHIPILVFLFERLTYCSPHKFWFIGKVTHECSEVVALGNPLAVMSLLNLVPNASLLDFTALRAMVIVKLMDIGKTATPEDPKPTEH